MLLKERGEKAHLIEDGLIIEEEHRLLLIYPKDLHVHLHLASKSDYLFILLESTKDDLTISVNRGGKGQTLA